MHTYTNWTSGLYAVEEMESELMLTARGKSLQPDGPEEGGTRDAASRRLASPTLYRLSYPGPSALLKAWVSAVK